MADDDKVTLEIRHRIGVIGDRFVVVENFGNQPEIRWDVPTREIAEALVKERKEALLNMVADISEDARQAVRDARHIDHMKSGRA